MVTEEEIERVRRCAAAEDALAALNVATGDNPWAGSNARLEQLQEACAAAARRERGEALIAALHEYARVLSEIEAATRVLTEVRERYATAERSPVVVRWQRARTVAAFRGFGSHWDCYSRWFQSGPKPAGMPRTEFEYPNPAWPEDLQFADEDRAEIQAWWELVHELPLAENALSAAQGLRASLFERHPELVDVDVERLPAILGFDR